MAALRVYDTVAGGTGTLPDALAIAQASLADARDRALTAEIVSGTFRWQAALDRALAGVSSRPLDRLDPLVLGILRLSAYQLLFLDRVPVHAVVFDAVTLTREAQTAGAPRPGAGGPGPVSSAPGARRRGGAGHAAHPRRSARGSGAAGFVNAVLRKLAQQDRASLWPPRPEVAGTFDRADLGEPIRTSAPEDSVGRARTTPPRRRLVPRSPSPRAADQAVDEALTYLSVTLSHPRWLVARWLARHGFEATEAWARFDNAPAPLTLRANTRRLTRDDLRQRLAEHDIVTDLTPYAPDGLIVREGHPLQSPLARTGLFTTQDEASQLVACLAQAAIPAIASIPSIAGALDPKADGEHQPRGSGAAQAQPRTRTADDTFAGGSRVLDACASPGGKTVALAAAVAARGSGGVVVATDRRRRRLRLLADTVTMAGAEEVRIAQIDLEAGLPFRDAFDLVLVDAPCSGLGTLRREPEIRWRRTEDELPALAIRQQRMLAEAALGVRRGGRLVYATCSSEPDENEAVAAAFLAAQPAFRPVPAQTLPLPASVAQVIDDRGHLRTWPFAHGLEAFFAAVFERDA